VGVCPLFFLIMATEASQAEILIGRLTSLLEPVVTDLDIELVEIQFRRESSGWVLRLIIDKEAGVSLDDCTEVSREVGRLLEVEDPIEHSYRLEVSSPGLERPLRKDKDYLRFKGRKAKIKTREPVDGQWVFIGTIEQFQDRVLTLQTDLGKITLPLDMIAKARLVFDL
jgi:ribosome maturation factor RimP